MRVSRNQFLVLLSITILALSWGLNAHACQIMVPVDPHAQISPEMSQRIRPIPRPVTTELPFQVTSSKVSVEINENIATTVIEQSFLNLSGQQLEARVLIPLPKGAAVNKSALSMGSTMVDGKLLKADEAQAVYESIVNQRRDPALLRFAGEDLYEARIFPIAPNEEKKLRFAYDQVLTPVNGLYDFRHILAGSQLYRTGAEKFDFTCTIKSKSTLGPVYSPSHTVSVDRKDEHTAVVHFSTDNLVTDRDFRLYFAPSTEAVSLRLLTYRESPNEDGYFMVLGRPDDQLEKSKVLAKELVLVLDTSGSMAGEKIEQAKKALAFCLSQLNERDRFNLITFSTGVSTLSPGKLLDATKENVKKALDAVDTIEATGGTNIGDALAEALHNDFTSAGDKARLVVFMTDGMPSVGVTDMPSILKDAQKANESLHVRLFTFGVGTDVNTYLLDKLALEHEGASGYVAPKEDLELKISDFYGKIKNPMMTDVKLEFADGVKANSIYPKKFPALFKGSEILIVGRYKGTGPAQITLKGNVAGEAREIRLAAEFPANDSSAPFLPRLWAMRKVGNLLEEIRLNGPNQELINEVVDLAQKHGIVTPYTSQLVLEPGMQGRGRDGQAVGFNDARRELQEKMAKDDKGMRDAQAKPAAVGEAEAKFGPGAAIAKNQDRAENAKKEANQMAQAAQQQQTGQGAVGLAESEKRLKDATNADSDTNGFVALEAAKPTAPPAPDSPAYKQAASNEWGRQMRTQSFAMGGGQNGGKQLSGEQIANYVAAAQEFTVRQIGAQTFYNNNGTWVASTLRSGPKPEVIKAFSTEYFALIKKHTELGAALALGGQLIVELDGKVYQFEAPEVKAQ